MGPLASLGSGPMSWTQRPPASPLKANSNGNGHAHCGSGSVHFDDGEDIARLVYGMRSVGSTSEHVGQMWRLFMSMSRSQVELLESFTGKPQLHWKRLENASWRVWASQRLAQRRPAKLSQTILLGEKPRRASD